MSGTQANKIDERRLRALYLEDGVKDVRVLASIFDCTERSIQRALIRFQLRQKLDNRKITEEQIEAMKRLHEVGTPQTWIAETVGCEVSSVVDYVGPRRDPEWRSVWQEIRRNPTLLELHREFKPRQGVA